LVTFERTLQTGLDDHLLWRRIALLREYYLREAPELGQYLVTVPPSHVLMTGSLLAGRRQVFRTVAGMVGVITGVLAGATAGLIATAVSDHSLAAALSSGIVVALASIVLLMRSQASAYRLAGTTPLLSESDSNDAQ
jgi:ABC-type antimicrobial peptide transport system permease subunit